MTAFENFLDRLRPVRSTALPTPARLAANQNRKHLAVSLHALLATDSREPDSDPAEQKVLALLKATL